MLGTVAGVLAVCTAALLPGAAEAQYFGRNKVVWHRFDFEVLETPHFEILYYPPSSDRAEYVAAIAERWYARLSQFFDHELTEKKTIVIYADHADFQQTTVSSGLIGEGIGGFTESIRHRVVLPLTGINAENDHVIGHELVHVFQFDLAEHIEPAQGATQAGGAAQLPSWAIEGLAEYLSQGRVDPATALEMRDAVLYDSLPQPGKLIQRQPSPYQYGQALWAYMAGRWGDDAVRRFFTRAMRVGPSRAFVDVLGLEHDAFLEDFHAALRSAYAPVLADRESADSIAEPLLTSERTGGSANLAPSLSPDGRSIAFLSNREFAVELYLADAETGEIRRKLVSAETDPHFQNLSFLDSSVAWSPDGRRFAFGVFAKGERRLAIYDLDEKRVVRVLELPGIKGMKHAAYTPDGRAIVFSAIVSGGSDLYRFRSRFGPPLAPHERRLHGDRTGRFAGRTHGRLRDRPRRGHGS